MSIFFVLDVGSHIRLVTLFQNSLEQIPEPVIFDTADDEQYRTDQLDLWIEQAQSIGNKYLDRFVKTLQNWKKPIAAFASTRISNAVTEGLNNYLRYFKRVAFGLPNFEHMRLRILMATI